MNNFLSTKNIPVRERLIFAMDLPSVAAAEEMIDRLGDSVLFYKLGLQMFMTGGYFQLVEKLQKLGKRSLWISNFLTFPKPSRTP